MTKSGIKISSLGVLCAVSVHVCVPRISFPFCISKMRVVLLFCTHSVSMIHTMSHGYVLTSMHTMCMVCVCVCAVKCTSRAIRVSHCIWYRLANIFWLDGVLLLRFCQINNMKILCKTYTHPQAQRIRTYVCMQAITNTHYASKQCKIEMIATEWWMVWPPKKTPWQKIARAQFEAE